MKRVAAHFSRPAQCLFLVAVVLMALQLAQAAPLVPPEDPSQSINYWKPHVIDPQEDAAVAQAHRVFDNLLRAWDDSRIAPRLHVVESAAGPWAASLVDGNILLSREAIAACQAQGASRTEHLLAFVLSHELAHQKADDLWHQKFFRLSGTQGPEIQRQMLKGLKLSEGALDDLERREARADHDGLIMMATVGYDPFAITDQRDFFTAWVENVWDASCNNGTAEEAVRQACAQAKSRALRTQTQWVTVANQTTLFELGIQAFIAGHHEQARELFVGFGRDYPSRAVHFNIGLTYLAQAVALLEQSDDILPVPGFYFPLMLDVDPKATPIGSATGAQKRGDQRRRIHAHLLQAVDYFEKAIRLEPAHREAYLYLALAHLLDNNTFMVRGVLQGQYQPQFGADPALELLLAMTSAFEGKREQAVQGFKKLLGSGGAQGREGVLPPQVLRYAAHFNYAVYLKASGDAVGAQRLWQDLAQQSQQAGDSLLFRLALHQLKPATAPGSAVTPQPQVQALRVGDRPKGVDLARRAAAQSTFWHEGEQFTILRFADGSRLVLGAKQEVVAAWQHGGVAAVLGLAVGDAADRPMKSLGLPSRRVHSIKGEYLAYDALGLAIHIVDDKVAGWFLYQG